MSQPSFRPETGLPDMDAARFTAEQRFDVLIPQEARFGALIQDNIHLPVGRYEVEVPPIGQHVMIFVLNPRPLEWEVGIAGRQRRVTGRPDELMLFPSGADLRFLACRGREKLLHFHLGPDWLAGLAADAGVAGPRLRVMTEVRDLQLGPLLRRLSGTLKEDMPFATLIREQVAVLVAAELLRLLGTEPAPGRHHIAPARLRAVLTHVEERLAEDITLAEMAAVAQLSRFHFARAFRAQIGTTPQGHVAQRRVERAKVLILDGGLSLAEVALACGFAHQAHFTTVFRRQVGTTPGRWRRERLS